MKRNTVSLDEALVEWRRLAPDQRDAVFDIIRDQLGFNPLIAHKYYVAAELLRAAAEPECEQCGGLGTDHGHPCPACRPRKSAAAEPEAKAEEVIKVQREEFERDPLSWFRRASTTRRVVVMEGEELSLVIGGSMDGLAHHATSHDVARSSHEAAAEPDSQPIPNETKVGNSRAAEPEAKDEVHVGAVRALARAFDREARLREAALTLRSALKTHSEGCSALDMTAWIESVDEQETRPRCSRCDFLGPGLYCAEHDR